MTSSDFRELLNPFEQKTVVDFSDKIIKYATSDGKEVSVLLYNNSENSTRKLFVITDKIFAIKSYPDERNTVRDESGNNLWVDNAQTENHKAFLVDEIESCLHPNKVLFSADENGFVKYSKHPVRYFKAIRANIANHCVKINESFKQLTPVAK